MKINQFITQLLEHCGLEKDQIEIVEEQKDEKTQINITIPEEDSGIFIGHHGEGLDSIQRLVRIISSSSKDKEEEKEERIVLNINGYREKRQARLEEMANNIAQRVLESGRKFTINSYLPSHERFIIHATLANNPDYSELESVSEGFGQDRKLTIRLKNN